MWAPPQLQQLHLSGPAPRPPALVGTVGWAQGPPVVGAEPCGDLLPAAGSASARACWPRTATSPPASPRGPASARGSTCLTIRTPDSAPRPRRRRRPSACSSPAPPAPAPPPPRRSPCCRSPPCPRPASRCTAPACWRRASPLVSGPRAGLQGARLLRGSGSWSALPSKAGSCRRPAAQESSGLLAGLPPQWGPGCGLGLGHSSSGPAACELWPGGSLCWLCSGRPLPCPLCCWALTLPA